MNIAATMPPEKRTKKPTIARPRWRALPMRLPRLTVASVEAFLADPSRRNDESARMRAWAIGRFDSCPPEEKFRFVDSHGVNGPRRVCIFLNGCFMALERAVMRANGRMDCMLAIQRQRRRRRKEGEVVELINAQLRLLYLLIFSSCLDWVCNQEWAVNWSRAVMYVELVSLIVDAR